MSNLQLLSSNSENSKLLSLGIHEKIMRLKVVGFFNMVNYFTKQQLFLQVKDKQNSLCLLSWHKSHSLCFFLNL